MIVLIENYKSAQNLSSRDNAISRKEANLIDYESKIVDLKKSSY